MDPELIHRRWRVPVGALWLVLALTGCEHARVAPLVRLLPLALSRPVSRVVEETAIETALAGHRWVIVQHLPRRYVARFDARRHEATIAINYGPLGIEIDYLTSANLLYGRDYDGREMIHPRYNLLVMELANGIAAQLALAPDGQTLSTASWAAKVGST